MADPRAARKQMLLLEPDALLRRTVAMTARTLDLAHVHEAASEATAARMLGEKVFHGAIIAVRLARDDPPAYDLSLLDSVRAGRSASDPDMPIAVMVEQCDMGLLASLQARAVSRIILKPFRVRVLLDAFADLARSADAMPERGAAPAVAEDGRTPTPLAPAPEEQPAAG